MKKGTSNTLTFTYDAGGTPLTVTWNGAKYYYATNLQGDVVAILNADGTTAASYTYDAWGKCLNSYTSGIGFLNPLRYRGYVYDQQTELYYLQSRYYDPELGRFVNADALVATGQGFVGNNTFVYCLDNPVSCTDSSGTRCVPVHAYMGGGTQSNYNEYGAAPEYVEIGESDGNRATNPNCLSYVLGDYSQSYELYSVMPQPHDYSLNGASNAFICYVKSLGRGCRPIDSYDSPIGHNEYRVALSVAEIETKWLAFIPYDTEFDYHFMVQTNTGQWAEKVGTRGGTILHPDGNPDTISWDRSDMGGRNYTCGIRYFAITVN